MKGSKPIMYSEYTASAKPILAGNRIITRNAQGRYEIAGHVFRTTREARLWARQAERQERETARQTRIAQLVAGVR